MDAGLFAGAGEPKGVIRRCEEKLVDCASPTPRALGWFTTGRERLASGGYRISHSDLTMLKPSNPFFSSSSLMSSKVSSQRGPMTTAAIARERPPSGSRPANGNALYSTRSAPRMRFNGVSQNIFAPSGHCLKPSLGVRDCPKTSLTSLSYSHVRCFTAVMIDVNRSAVAKAAMPGGNLPIVCLAKFRKSSVVSGFA